jgi:glycosyltransferase involved in cell wall biosynthesis
MNLAIVHEWLTNMAGSERVVQCLHEVFPDAPIYTSIYAPDAMPEAFREMDLRTTFLQRWPGAQRHYKLYLPLMPAAFESLDLSEYDVVLSNSHACAKGVLTRSDTCHLCYCYTPIRYAWEFYHDYLRSDELGWLARQLVPPMMRRLRLWDFQAAQRPDYYCAISHHVRQRIRKHYRREADVIYPPVDVAAFAEVSKVPKVTDHASRITHHASRDFFLVVSRLVQYKRVDLAVRACTELRRPLVVVGVGPEEGRLRAMAGETVQFLGWQTDEQVRALYAAARALLFPGEEDFGLTPVEAQAAGTPVVAFARGGALETVLDGVTGVFFHEPAVASLSDAIRRLDTLPFDPATLQTQARRFDVSVFQTAMRQWIEEKWQEYRQGMTSDE